MRPIVYLLSLILLAGFGCSRYATVTSPPKVDLKEFGTIGVVTFDLEGAKVVSGEEVMHRFLASIQSAQPGVRLLELGAAPAVLAGIGHDTMDLEAIRAIGEQYGVGAVLTGVMKVSQVTPSFSLSQAMTSMSAQAKIDGALRAKLRETASGATVWTNGAHGRWEVASISLDSTGRASSYGLTDPSQRYEKMLTELVRAATADLRSSRERRRLHD